MFVFLQQIFNFIFTLLQIVYDSWFFHIVFVLASIIYAVMLIREVCDDGLR